MSGIEVVSPEDGRILGVYPPLNGDAVRARVDAARRDGARWAAIPVAERVRRLAALRVALLARQDEIVATVSAVSGKVPTDVLLGEIVPLLAAIQHMEKHAAKVLKRRRVATSPMLFPFAYAYVDHRPYGVVAVISPWNYPFQLAVFPALTALAAGNTVCLKPSELSLPVCELIESLFREVEGLGDALQVIAGDGETGRHLVEAGPDLIFFTGGTATGQQIMSAAARTLTPVILELGGKDPMLVFDDAHLERAVRGALYGAFTNAGQTCIGIERVYVQRTIYPAFVEAAVSRTAELKVGAGIDNDIGAISSPQQMAIIEEHYRDAVEKGAEVSGPLRREGNYLRPLVLWDVDHGMKLMREESFGPLLAIMPFDTEEEAVDLANDSELGLNASVWTADLNRGRSIAARLRVGGCSVNDVLKLVAHPELPFGGAKRSGFGRYHGPEGLLQFCQPQSILVNAGRKKTEPNWFPYSAENYANLRGFFDFLYGEGHMGERFKRNWKQVMSFRDYVTMNLRQRFGRID